VFGGQEGISRLGQTMTAIRPIAWTAALLVNLALLAGLRTAPFLQHVLQEEALPEPFVRHSIKVYPWPLSRELASTLTGLTEREVQAFFNDPYTLPPSPGQPRCLEFRVDWDPAVTVLFRAGKAEQVWVYPNDAPSAACPTRIVRRNPWPMPLR
jgi:hypothetical protein